MSKVLSQPYLNGLNKGYARIFAGSLDRAVQAPNRLSGLICFDQNAAGFANMQYDWESGVLLLTEVPDSGMQAGQNLSSKQKTVNNKVYTRLLRLKREVLEREQAQVYNRQFGQAGPAVILTREKLLATRLKEGFTGGFFTTTDKKVATGKAATYTNSMTKKFSTANFDTALETLQSQVDSEGNNLGLGTDANNLILVVSPTYRKTAAKCIGAKLVDGGDENVNAGIAKLVVWGQLGTTALKHHWFLFDTSIDKPCVVQNEVPPALYMQTNPEDGTVMTSGEFLSQIYWRGNVDLIEPQWCYGSTGADAA